MSWIPPKIKGQIIKDPTYQTCLRRRYFNDHVCQGRVTWEHAIIYAGNQLQEKWAIIPICEYAHSVGRWQNNGILDKEKNVYLALIRATNEELASISKAVDYLQLRKYLNKKYESQRQ